MFKYITRFVVLILLIVFGIVIFFNSSVFANGQKSKEYYSTVIGSQINMRLHGEDVDTRSVLEQEILTGIFSFFKFKLDEVYKESLLNEKRD